MNREGAPGKSPEDVYIQQKVRVLLMLRKMGSNLTASEEEFLRTYAGVVNSQLSQLPQHSIDQGLQTNAQPSRTGHNLSPSWGHSPESRTLPFCPHRVAKWDLAKILACPPHLLAGPTSADVPGVLLAGAQVPAKWQNPRSLLPVPGVPA
ncbi:beta-catenin-interacting protein 1 isoform X1 [Suricata suricatta]|uniref:Beta-catenin-interacting protein 1 n=1 Tax=Suricata suricatta TaxID=37032 RepID=A0A673UUJ1_SURSU|nr:beta-catenin-interacting protein 1 isoform X1 [Suricata suricatta]XP_029805070.1 beta-catenin-interacting protein 1 isoform X1 [Suricata suricatta]XP_029805071.1 beta-catenin-interacting protein 1 isoform X1 [Suricata suricatta]